MSIVSDQVRRLDAYLDRLPVLTPETSSEGDSDEGEDRLQHGFAVADAFANTPHLNHLLRTLQSLSTTASSQALLPAHRIRTLLHNSGIPALQPDVGDAIIKSPYENEIEWLLVSKATVQLHGVILNTLLEQIIPLSDDIWYWDSVLNSYTYSSLYTVQTSPWRLWAWTHDVWATTKARLGTTNLSSSPSALAGSTRAGLSQQWNQFYTIVQESIRERSFSNIQRKILSPVALSRAEVRKKQGQLKKLREITASGLGVLMDEGLQFGPDDDKAQIHDHHDLKGVVERSVALMDVVLKEVSHLDTNINDFEDKVFAGVEEDPELSVHIEDAVSATRPGIVGRRLLYIIDKILPQHQASMGRLTAENGRPPAIVRYWLPGVIGLLSSTTVLQILVNHKADIINWIADIGSTVRDFWFNWVVQPTEKVIKTIRHDGKSDIAIMSRDSLRADRESLEQMVVEFAMDRPQYIPGTPPLTETQIAEIRSKVAEGDVTPVLKAFQQDMRKPLAGVVRGDLVRSLLIQVQKTKVDLEVAMTGIDSLLKSQELVFGFVGLTPGILVCLGMYQYVRGMFGGSSRQSKKSGRAVCILRNIDRILSEARPTENNVLSYKDHGLLLCEVHVLRGLAQKHRMMPRNIEKNFLEDLDDLANIRGIQVQARALGRLRWAYARWLQ